MDNEEIIRKAWERVKVSFGWTYGEHGAFFPSSEHGTEFHDLIKDRFDRAIRFALEIKDTPKKEQ